MKNSLSKYIITGVALALVIFLCWYFSSIIAYVLVAVVVSFLGRPIRDFLKRLKIRGRQMSNTLCAALTIVCLWTVFVFFFVTIIPLVTREFQALSNINIERVVNSLEEPVNAIGNTLMTYGFIAPEQNVKEFLVNSLADVLNVSQIKNIFGSVANTITSIFIALFSITFIAFFFIKDSRMFTRIMVTLVPTQYEEGVANAIDSVQRLLVRYFVGIFFEVLIILILNTLGLSLIGIAFSHAILIGLITGITNVIPYLGPLLGALIGLAIGVVLHIEADFYTVMLPMLLYMGIVFIITQLIDNIVLQPLIYGTSVYAHPLEIFLVILVAGNVAGIPGMILAIPGYTVLRVVLKEFFNKYKLVKSLTKGLDQHAAAEPEI